MASVSWKSPANAHYIAAPAADLGVSATLVLSRKGDKPAAASMHAPRCGRGEFIAAYSASDEAVQSARTFLAANGLKETAYNVAARAITFTGTVNQMEKAFDVTLGLYQTANSEHQFHSPNGEPKLPPGAIAVLGLDTRPRAHSYLRTPHAPDPLNPFGATSYTPIQIASLYHFPVADGAGQSIGLIELGGGFTQEGLDQYFQTLSLPTPRVVPIIVGNGQNNPNEAAAGEVYLDIEVAGAIAPNATIPVYFTDNTDNGFYQAIAAAIHDTTYNPRFISISWGGPENEWSGQGMDALECILNDAAALGIVVTVAAGDNGATDGEPNNGLHCDFPASSPSVIACGGTKIHVNDQTITMESVWNETDIGSGAGGGGVSDIFARPVWQQACNVPPAPTGFIGRGVPDVSGDADPLSGYLVMVNGQAQVVGGTSAVAPLWAALLARINQCLAAKGIPEAALGDLVETLYTFPETTFRDITSGNNDGYNAAVGWDPSTGLGSPRGMALLEALVNRGSKS